MDGFDEAIAFLTALPRLVPAAAAAALDEQAPGVESDAQATVRYQDDTGATRGSTVAYVAGGGAGALVGLAFSVAESLNPDHAVVEEESDPAGEQGATLVLTTFTDYTADLITMQGGARDFLAATMEQHAGQLHDAAAAGIADLFGGAT